MTPYPSHQLYREQLTSLHWVGLVGCHTRHAYGMYGYYRQFSVCTMWAPIPLAVGELDMLSAPKCEECERVLTIYRLGGTP